MSIDHTPAAERHRLGAAGAYKPTPRGQRFIEQAIEVLGRLGYTPSLRALHYQRVAFHGAPNTAAEYKALSRYVADARWAGLIGMDAVADETRSLDWNPPGECRPFTASHARTHVESPDWTEGEVVHRNDLLTDRHENCHISTWWNPDISSNSPPLLLIEKSAMLPPFRDWCNRRGVALAATRGRPSTSMQWHLSKWPWRAIWLITDRDKTGDETAADTTAHLQIAYERRDGATCPPIKRLGLTSEQAEALDLTPVFGTRNNHEIDAVPQGHLLSWCADALAPHRAQATETRQTWQDEQAPPTSRPLPSQSNSMATLSVWLSSSNSMNAARSAALRCCHDTNQQPPHERQTEMTTPSTRPPSDPRQSSAL